MLKLPFMNLQVWQKGMILARNVQQKTMNFPRKEQYVITSQMMRSAISIPSNIAEGSQRKTNKEFAQFLLISLGSAAELQTQILLSKDFNYLSANDCSQLVQKTEEIRRMLAALHAKVSASDH